MPVIKGVGYSLIHSPDILFHNGSTQTTERAKNPESEYLAKLPSHLRSYDEVLSYAPNQAYIGNLSLDELRTVPRPWYVKPGTKRNRFGPYGEIMAEDEFYGLIKVADSFDLVFLETAFTAEVKAKLESHKIIPADLVSRMGKGKEAAEIEKLVAAHTAEGLYLGKRLVGCVRQAHEIDEDLAAHVMLENLVAKASSFLAVLHLLANAGASRTDIDYIIECSEEACGDINQRGGGNFAKAIGELAGLANANGCDVRGFCAGPVHALLHASSLVKSGVFRNVVVVGGGAVAKLGMNGKDHVAKNMPVLEDVLGTFAILVSENDGVNPVIRLDVVGKHNIGTGSSPQQVMKALVAEPVAKLNRRISDVDHFSAEMQNPELTEPAGAGNVPEANYKMIAALAVMAGEITRDKIPQFVDTHGLPGFAPTQGQIPSGVPSLGYFRERILSCQATTCMVIGKGSLFLGRMTNLFDGLSLVIDKNPGLELAEAKVSEETVRHIVAEALRDMAERLQ